MTKRNLILIVVIVIILFVGYKFFFADNTASTNSALTAETAAGQKIGADILEKLNALQGIDLDKNISFFETKAFLNLREEVGQKYDVQEIGRPNPFSPFTGDVVVPAGLKTN